MFAVLAGLRLAVPTLLASWFTARVSGALGVAAEVEDVELRLLAGEVTVRGIHAAPPAEDSASTLHVDALTLRWRWRDLVRGVVVVEGTMKGLDLTIDLYRPWPPERNAARSRSTHMRSLEIDSGTLAVVLAADTDPILALTDLHGTVLRSTGPRTELLTTRVSLTAQTGEGGSLTLDGAISPLAPAANWTVRFTLERLDLRRLNPLFERAFEMDVEHGWLSLDGWVNVGFGRLRGKIRPRFEELQLLGRDERRVRHPMAEALFSSMLSGADLPIDIDRSAAGDSAFDDLADIDAMQLLRHVILNGFIRRLDTLAGYESSAGGLEVDFPGGKLSFFDVTLTKKNGAVDRPFVTIARMDIVVEQSAVDSEVLTYKSIVLHRPSLTFVTGSTPAKSQLTFDPQWQEKVNVLPYPTDRVEIIDGRIEYRDDTTSPSTSLVVSDLDLVADNIGRAKAHSARRAARLVGSARVMDASALAIELEFTPGVVDLDAAIRLRLDPLPLRDLNVLLAGRLGIDVDSGTLAFGADLDVYNGELRGTVTPQLHQVRVLGAHETHFEHPLREFLLERRLKKLDGATLTLDRRVRTSVLRELPAALLAAARHAR